VAGNIVAAREYFLRAATGGSAAAAYRLAETYDPATLAAMGAIGVQADVAQARRWYGKALQWGMTAASVRLERLPAK
jgi:TPR repeat protein